MENVNHKALAIEAFNKTWEYIDLKTRNNEETLEMIHLAHASRYHWGFVGTELNKGRGEWQISRVYSISSLGESALLHAQRYLDICLKNNYMDWDIAFAYEGMARAYAIAGKNADCEKYIKLAKEAGEHIKEKGDKDLFFSELKTVPGYK